jgi:phosphoribosylformimino-5-aminoimidazole carboxamide ribotide isomerase
MRVIPVIDLMGGWVVRGVAGRREEYRPIQSRIAADAQPETIARAFVEQFGFDTAYVADLDAILFPPEQKEYYVSCYEQIARAGLAVWLDAGIGSAKTARHLRDTLERLAIDFHYVIGLESLAAREALPEIVAELGRERTIFSLDLMGGQPMKLFPQRGWGDPVHITLCAMTTGISRVIVLDLADVGVGRGPGTLDLCCRLRKEFGAGIELISGGGVRGIDDLRALAYAGCDGALVASALHNGKLTPGEVRGFL